MNLWHFTWKYVSISSEMCVCVCVKEAERWKAFQQTEHNDGRSEQSSTVRTTKSATNNNNNIPNGNWSLFSSSELLSMIKCLNSFYLPFHSDFTQLSTGTHSRELLLFLRVVCLRLEKVFHHLDSIHTKNVHKIEERKFRIRNIYFFELADCCEAWHASIHFSTPWLPDVCVVMWKYESSAFLLHSLCYFF